MNAATAEQRSWTQAGEGLDTMAHMSSELDDLSNIFNIGDFDLEAIQNQTQQYGADGMHTTHTEAHPTTPFLETMPQTSHGTATHDFGGEHNGFALPADVDGLEGQFNGNALYQQQLSQHYSHMQQSPYQMPQQHFSGGQIPPTPNSYEMHGEAGRFLQQQHQVMFEQQKHLRKLEQQRILQQQQAQQHQQHAQFTPMASPDGTPQYAIQAEFTTPGAYFSPLTSPALHAQLPPASSRNLVQQAQGYFTNPSTAPSSNAPSPVDLNGNDIEMTDGMAMGEANKRVRRKIATPRSVGQTMTNSRPRQSPIQKPQKRKSGLLTSIVPPKDLDKMLTEGTNAQPASGVSHFVQNMDSSESGSISPEPLSESLMGPPPRPTTNSPAMNAQQHTSVPQHMQQFGLGKAAAATPKSILSMRSQEHIENGSLAQGQAMLDELELPEAAKKQALRPSLTTIDVVNTEQSSRKTPKLGPLSTPSSTRLDALSASPVTSYSPTASTPGGLLKDKKGDSKSRAAKKRGSIGGGTGSALASPALRPRISPSIKPLLPEGSALHSPTHALLLASKSNYQNLLEGNHLPGVSYPDSLSTGLTSKRTSHKVAEQGRRNRINEALKEMQALIPSPSILAKQTSSEDVSGSKDEDGSPEANDDKDGKDSAAKSNSSKAATVESANRYIRLLKESDMSQKAAILALKKENEEIRRRLARATGAPDSEMTSIQEVEDMHSSSD